MKIVELDGYAANPGDISWDAWHNIQTPDGNMCEFIQYDHTTAEKVIERAKEILQQRHCMTEPEAHRYLQKCAMDSGTDMLETAEMIISLTNI